MWWDWPGWVTYGIIGIAILTSPISWIRDERKRAKKRDAVAGQPV